VFGNGHPDPTDQHGFGARFQLIQRVAPWPSACIVTGIVVLVCDDQPDVLVALDILLKDGGYRARMTASPNELLSELNRQPVDLVLTDMNFHRDTTSGKEGLELVESICRRPEHPPVVVMTAWADIDLAVEAVRRGAVDFVQKPWDNSKLLASLQRAIRQSRGGRTEMETARLVQERLLPRREYRVGRARFRASFDPAGEVGGDYFDFFQLGPDRCGFLLADVSGKGVPAALLMANLQALFHAQEPALLSAPAKLLERVNDLFFRSTAPEHYATLFYGAYDGSREELTYVNCGHPPATVKRIGGNLEECAATGLPVGLFPSARCTERTVRLGRAERLVACSDGITEADMGEDDKTRIELRIE
jgi:sigma-B regulation protein RsbU (phosphoserine phosphatase)